MLKSRAPAAHGRSLPRSVRGAKLNPARLRRIAGAEGLPYNHTYDMVVRMKTTLIIPDSVMAELKQEAARQGRTMSELVEMALRKLLESQKKPPKKLLKLPSFGMGRALVDIADRDALYRAMEEEK